MNTDFITIKIKENHMHVYAGVVFSEKIMSVPLDLIHKITFSKDVKQAVLNALIEKSHYEVIMRMGGISNSNKSEPVQDTSWSE